MKGPSFVDTNVLVCARDGGAVGKQGIAADTIKDLWQNRTGRLSIQVLNEYYATITRKLNLTVAAEAWDDVMSLMTWNPQPVDQDLLVAAREIERRHGMSWWDATIVAAAQAQRCTVLLSEDFQDGMRFGQLTVRNPFAPRVSEPPGDDAGPLQPSPRHRPRGRPSRSA